MYAYQADLWCDGCGRIIKEELDVAGKKDTGETDDYPQYSDEENSETDCPNHCGGGEGCVNSIELADGRKIGILLEEQLTVEGRSYVIEQHTTEPSEVTELWISTFGITLPDNEGDDE